MTRGGLLRYNALERAENDYLIVYTTIGMGYMTNEIRVATEEDDLFLMDDKIHAIVNSREYIYELSRVKKIVLLTTELGPFYDDMGLAIDVGNNDVIFIMSEHKCYSSFLFDQIGKALPIDYQKILDASSCTDNKNIELYVKDI